MLIDTHILLWFQAGEGKLSDFEISEIEGAYRNREVSISCITIWELAFKARIKRLTFHLPFDAWLKGALQGVNVINIDADVAMESIYLPDCEHKDPADRFIIATARVHDLPLMTHDKKIRTYANKGYVSLI